MVNELEFKLGNTFEETLEMYRQQNQLNINNISNNINNTNNGCKSCNPVNQLGIIQSLATILPNPGFETDPTVNYEFKETVVGSGTGSWAPAGEGRAGGRAAKIVTTQANGQMSRWQLKIGNVAATAGSTYYATIYVKSSALAQYGQLTVDFFDGTGAIVGSATGSSTTIAGTTDWKQLSVNAVAGTGTASVRIGVRLYGAGTIWIDDGYLGTSPETITPCPSVAMNVGDVLTLKTIPTGGSFPYTVKFKRNGTDIANGTFTGIAEGALQTFSYAVMSTDSPSVTLETLVTDSCGTPQTCSKNCIVTVNAAPCSPPSCDFTVTNAV